MVEFVSVTRTLDFAVLNRPITKTGSTRQNCAMIGLKIGFVILRRGVIRTFGEMEKVSSDCEIEFVVAFCGPS